MQSELKTAIWSEIFPISTEVLRFIFNNSVTYFVPPDRIEFANEYSTKYDTETIADKVSFDQFSILVPSAPCNRTNKISQIFMNINGPTIWLSQSMFE